MPRLRAGSSTSARLPAATSALERVVVINLLRRPERQARLVEQLRSAGLHDRAELFRAFDALEIDDGLLERMGVRLFPNWEQPDSAQMYHARPIKLGEVGCALSHLSVWRMIVARGWRATLILEDDVVVSPTLARSAAALLRRAERHAPGWDLLYLGRNRLLPTHAPNRAAEAEPRVAEGLVKPSFSYCAHAYVLSLGGAKRLLASGFERALCAVDELLPALYCRHPRKDVRGYFGTGRRIAAIAAEPALVQVDYEGSDTDASAYVPGARAPRYRWASAERVLRPGRAGAADQLAFLVAGRPAQLGVQRHLRTFARRLLTTQHPSVAVLDASEARYVLELEQLLFRLLRRGALVRAR